MNVRPSKSFQCTNECVSICESAIFVIDTPSKLHRSSSGNECYLRGGGGGGGGGLNALVFLIRSDSTF